MRNKRNNVWTKWLSVCIALLLTISMVLPAQAAVQETAKYSITVTGKETDANATVTAYRIMKANFDFANQQAKEPLYQWEDAVAAWLQTNETYKAYVGVGNKVEDAFINATAGARSAVMTDIGKAVKADTLKLTAVQTATIDANTYQTVLTNLEMGGYLLLTSPDPSGKYASYEYSPITANLLPVYEGADWKVDNVAVALKGNPTSIEKTADKYAVSIGDTVTYTLNVPVPTYPDDATGKIFRIGDTLPKGITFAENVSENQLKVFAVYGDGQADQPIAAESGNFTYYYNMKDCGSAGILTQNSGTAGRNATFILDFDYKNLMQNYGKRNGKALQGIKVTYQGTINEYAFENGALENTAYTGKNDPYNTDDYQTTDDKEKVFTYGIDVTKVMENGTTPLAGAEFELSTSKEGKAIQFVQTGDGEYRVAKAGEGGATGTLAVGAADTKAVGKLILKGLATGTYYLKEIKAPAGYELLKDPIEITLTDKEAETPDAEGAGELDQTGSETVTTGNIYYQTVVNKKPPIMPVTGGMGTILFSILGIILVAGGVTLIVNYQKRNRA